MDFEQLFNAYYMQIFSYLMSLSGDSGLSEELTQQTFFKAYTSNSYKGKASEFTWLCAIAKNLFYDEMRKKKPVGESEEQPAADDPALTVADSDAAYRLHKILHTLDEPYKEVFGLRVFGELSFSKIGLLFGKTESWARVTYHRARLKIQERMK